MTTSFILNSGRFGAVDPGLTLLQSATLWLDMATPGGDSQKVANSGTGGTALDARLCSTTSVDTNDPLLLTHTGTNYLYLPGITGNNASAPDSAALSITGDIDIMCRVAPSDWTPAVTALLAGKWSSSAATQAYALFLETTGVLRWVEYSGAAYNDQSSTVATGFTDGATKWVRTTYNSATGDTKFYTAADESGIPSAWTQLGTTVAGTARAIQDTTNALTIGESTTAGSNLLTGSVYRVAIKNGYDGAGTTVFDANFSTNTNQSSFTESSSNAATVTINRATSGRKSVMVTRAVMLFGTDDYLEVADNALLDFGASESFSVVYVGRQWGTSANYGTRVSKHAGGVSVGYALLGDQTLSNLFVAIGDGVVQTYRDGASQAFTLGALHQETMVRDVGLDTLRGWVGTTGGTAVTDATTASLANALALNVGRNPSGTAYYNDMEVIAVAVFRSALDSTQIGQIATYYGV